MEQMMVEPTLEVTLQQEMAEQAHSSHVDGEMDWSVRMFYEDDEEYSQQVQKGKEKISISLLITFLLCLT